MAKRTCVNNDQLTFDLRVQRCPACTRDLPGWDFPKDKKRKLGLAGYCYACWRVKQRAYHAKRMQDPTYREHRRKKWNAWQRENKGLLLEIRRRYHLANPGAGLRANQAWRRSNPDAAREAVRAWSKSHPEVARAYAGKRRALKNNSATVPFTLQQLAARWDYYGNRCWICRDIATATDHVKPLSKGGAHMLCNLRPICKPCNSKKHNKWPFSVNVVRCA